MPSRRETRTRRIKDAHRSGSRRSSSQLCAGVPDWDWNQNWHLVWKICGSLQSCAALLDARHPLAMHASSHLCHGALAAERELHLGYFPTFHCRTCHGTPRGQNGHDQIARQPIPPSILSCACCFAVHVAPLLRKGGCTHIRTLTHTHSLTHTRRARGPLHLAA